MSGPRASRERWSAFSLEEQLGNIGSEVGRAINARKNEDFVLMEGAINRALDLFLATFEAALKEKKNMHRIREVIRARDEFMSLFYKDTFDVIEAQKIEAYFMNFAYIARSRL